MSLVKKYSKKKDTCKVTFSLPKEAVQGGKNVLLVGEFNNWNPAEGIALVNKKSGYETVIELASGRKYEYRYLVDGRTWVNDFKADAYVPNSFGTENSVVAIPATMKTTKKTTAKKVTAKKTVAKKTTSTAKKVTTKRTATKKATPTAKKTTTKKTVAKRTKPTTKKVTTKKVVAKKAVKVAATKLTMIEGVGPKIQTLLNKAGIKTFANLSTAKVTTLRNILKDAGSRFTMHDPSTWAKQAKMAAKGNWDQLKTLQDKLKGGRK